MESSEPLVELRLDDSPEMAAGEAFAEWESLLSESYVPLAVDPERDEVFHGRIVRGSLPGFELSTVGASGQRIRRTKSGIARTDGEFLFVSILTEGFGRLHQDGRIAVLRPGDMVFYDTTRPYHWDIDGSWSQVVARVPLSVLGEHIPTGRDALPTATTVHAESPAGVVAGFFRDLARIQQSAPGDKLGHFQEIEQRVFFRAIKTCRWRKDNNRRIGTKSVVKAERSQVRTPRPIYRADPCDRPW